MTAPYSHANPGPFLRLPAVCKETGKSQASIYRDMQDGTFPRPVVLGPNARAWIGSEIEAWKAKRIADRDSGTDADMRVVNRNIGRGRQRKGDQQHAV